jgi:hypothetical protein
MTLWYWLGELLRGHGGKWVEGHSLWVQVGFGVWAKYGAWPIIYSGYQPIHQL